MEKTNKIKNKEKQNKKTQDNNLKKGDFIELIYTGKIKNGEVFDSNKPEIAKQLYKDAKVKPLILSIGNKMILPAIDEDFLNRKIGESYKLELSQEKAFGKRNPSLIRTIPIKVFHEKNIQPQSGMVFNMDGQIVKIINVSGGRVITDFNNPLAGKDVLYEIKINKKIINKEKQINSVFEFLLNQVPEYELKNKNIILKDKKFKLLADIFKPKFKEILNLNLITEDSNNEKTESKQQKT